MSEVQPTPLLGGSSAPTVDAVPPRVAAPGLFVRAQSLAWNGGALIVNVLVSALTGLGFWILTARLAPPEVVANGSAAITAIISVVSMSQQSFVLTVPSLLPTVPEPRRLALSMYKAALVITAIVAPLYVVVGPIFADGLTFLHDWRLGVAFVAGSLVWCVFSLQDAVLTGVRKATLVLVENTSWGLLRLSALGLLWLLGTTIGVGWLFAAWLVPAAAMVLVLSWYLFLSGRSPLVRAQERASIERRGLLTYMGAEFAASALSSALSIGVTAYVLTALGATAAAPVLTAVSLVVVIEGALASFAQALAVEVAGSDGSSRQRRDLAKLSALLLGMLSFGAIAVAVLFGEQVMGLFGEHYRSSGGLALGILMLAVPFRGVILVSNADNRARRQGGRNLVQQAFATIVCIGMLLTGAFTTVAGLCWLFVVLRVATAAVAAVQLEQGRFRSASA